MFAKQYEAEEALAIGLIDRLCDEGKTLDDAIAYGEEIAKRPPLAIRAVLKIMSASASMSPEQHLKIEREELAKLFSTKDMMEGMTAFMQKRPAVFTGE